MGARDAERLRLMVGVLASAAVFLFVACASAPVDGPVPSATSPVQVPSARATITHGSQGGPVFEVRYADTALELAAYTFCTSGGGVGRCVDGVDADPPRIGSPPEVFVRVSVAEFDKLEVSQAPESDSDQMIAARVESLGGQWWRVRPSASSKAGTYRVSLFASGNGTGDMAADVIWEVKGE